MDQSHRASHTSHCSPPTWHPPEPVRSRRNTHQWKRSIHDMLLWHDNALFSLSFDEDMCVAYSQTVNPDVCRNRTKSTSGVVVSPSALRETTNQGVFQDESSEEILTHTQTHITCKLQLVTITDNYRSSGNLLLPHRCYPTHSHFIESCDKYRYVTSSIEKVCICGLSASGGALHGRHHPRRDTQSDRVFTHDQSSVVYTVFNTPTTHLEIGTNRLDDSVLTQHIGFERLVLNQAQSG